ncbi:MAG TPA: PAS domain S-box protein [Spirochaetota bacterium]|nr:PAS domain S-box protein [Spirochaetota bacterium]HQF08303.1 PAS domain S-box protein [Spirochaetota bacterium]HQH97082.1 PAS domain S-box protein [Spirochaetota bacterium]
MSKTKILIVEDEAIVAMHIQGSLEKLNYEVCGCVKSGEEAVSLAAELKPDLILMDIVLKGPMDGIEAAKIIKDTLAIPVVYMTGNADLPTITRARETNPYGYILKPVNILHLYSMIDTALHRYMLESSLGESEKKYRFLTDKMSDMVWMMDMDLRTTYASPSMEKILGFTPEERYAQKLEDMLTPESMKTALEKWAEELKVEGTPGVDPDRIIVMELEYYHKKGHTVWVENKMRPIRDHEGRVIGIHGVSRDITGQKQAEEALRQSERRFRALVDNLEDFILIVDGNGVITYENPITSVDLGFSTIGRNAFELIHPDDAPKVLNDFKEAVRGVNPHTPTFFRIRKNDGSLLYLEALAANMLDDPGIKGILVACHDVTQRVNAENTLRDREERYRALFDQSPVGVFTYDRDMKITDCNEVLARMMKVKRENLIGLDLNDQKDERLLQGLRRVLGGAHASYEGPYRSTLADFQLWVSVRGNPLRDESGAIIGGMIVMEDVTERNIAQEKLKASEERNRLLVENANEGIVVLQDWRFVFVNPRFVSLAGYPREYLRSRDFTEFVHPDDREMIADRYRRRLDGDRTPFIYEARLVDRAGVIRWVELNSVLFSWEGKPAVLLFIRDIGERKQAEEERSKMEAQIQQTQKLESLGVLAGGIAHDFNNLLMAILGNIDLALLDLSPSSPSRGNLMEAAKASQRAADLCRQMLAYSGKGRFMNELINLNEIIEDMKHMLEVSVSKKAMLRYNFVPNLPSIEADATQVRQIIMNLVINASDAIGEKSGFISLSTGVMMCDRAYLSETWLNEGLPEGAYVYIEVADTGCGMDPVMLPKIFDPFFTTKFTGRGLGLAAVLGIVRSHRGAIKLFSERGRGTTFRILLPAVEGAAERAEETRAMAQGWQGSGTVMLVDDEETIRALGKRMLERLGFTVVTASNGKEALDLYRERPGVFGCIILDLTMPHMDGDEAFREFRKIRNDVRVIMSSGYNEQEITRRFSDQGPSGFIQKPYQMESLAATLKEVLG